MAKRAPYKRRMKGREKEDDLILYRFHAHGVMGRGGEIQVVLDEPAPPTPNPTWAYDDAENLYKMIQNFFPKATVDLVRGAFLDGFSSQQLLQELERRLE